MKVGKVKKKSFFQKEHNLTYSEEDVMFFQHQLDLFGKLAYVSFYDVILATTKLCREEMISPFL